MFFGWLDSNRAQVGQFSRAPRHRDSQRVLTSMLFS
jgi:hypothetical protein